MRRVTWLVANPSILMPEHLSKENYFAEASGQNKVDTGYLAYHLYRQPMQRTEYYMSWGTVTVDELSKMSFAENYTVVLAYDPETKKWRA